MRTETVVPAQIRESRGKNEARRTRRAGLIPGVVYGAFKDPVSVAVDPKAVTKIIRSKTGHNTIFNVEVAGGKLPRSWSSMNSTIRFAVICCTSI